MSARVSRASRRALRVIAAGVVIGLALVLFGVRLLDPVVALRNE